MAATIDYYFAPQSPWAYLGHERFVALARAADADVRVRPVDLGRVFPLTGGLPLGKRAPQRQAYRLVELKRFSDHLGVALHLQPRHFPVAGDDAARLILAVDAEAGPEAALRMAGAVFAAVWAQERDIAASPVLGALLEECGLPTSLLARSRDAQVQQRYDDHTAAALEAGVFGSPSYVVDGEIFWGQDRLDFLARRLSSSL